MNGLNLVHACHVKKDRVAEILWGRMIFSSCCLRKKEQEKEPEKVHIRGYLEQTNKRALDQQYYFKLVNKGFRSNIVPVFPVHNLEIEGFKFILLSLYLPYLLLHSCRFFIF